MAKRADIIGGMRGWVRFLTVLLALCVPMAGARILFTNITFEGEPEMLTIDANGDAASDVILQFGAVINETLRWDITNSRFLLSDDLAVNGTVDVFGNSIVFDADNVGTAADVEIIANQGTNPDGILRYNALEQRWEISNDGGATFDPIAIAGNTGSFTEGGAFISYNTSIEEEFYKKQNTISIDTTGVNRAGMGDGGGWGGYESSNCTLDYPDDVINGILRMQSNSTNNGCLLMIDDAIRNPRLIVDPARLPFILMKVEPTSVSANNILFAGIGNATDGNVTNPTEFIGFTNNGGTTWTGRTTTGGTATNVTCTGQTVQTSVPAVLKVVVESTSSVRFFVDNDASDGTTMVECGVSTTNIPTTNLAPQFQYQTRTGGSAPNSLAIDFFKLYSN